LFADFLLRRQSFFAWVPFPIGVKKIKMGWTNRYRFVLEDDDGNTRDCIPYNKDLLITGDRKSNRFNWSYVIGDPVVFEGADFDWLYTLEQDLAPGDATRCGGSAFRIYETCGGVETLKYEFFINLNEAEFFPDDCTVVCKLQPVDAFSCIYRHWEDELDVLDLVVTKHKVPGLVGYVERVNCPEETFLEQDPGDLPILADNCLPDAFAWKVLQTYWVTFDINGFYPYTYDGYAITAWVRERVDDSATEPPGDGWIDLGGDSWVRELELYPATDYLDYYFSIPPTDTILKIIKTYKIVGADPNIVEKTPYYTNHILGWNVEANDPIPHLEYSNGMLFVDVLDALVNNGCALTLKSNFFRINPDDPFPAAEPYPTAAAGFDKLMIWQLSDVARPEVSEDATDLKITLRDFLEELRNVFNVDWTIETGGVFRIEHISYFVNQNGEDLTLAPWDQYTRKKNAYRYDSVKIPKAETFSFSFKTTPFFNGLPIIYSWTCASSDLKDKNFVAKLTSTDLGYINQVGDNSPLSGMFIGAMIDGGGFGIYDYYFAREDDGAGNPRNNGHLAFTKLHPNYWKWDRPQTSGQMNGTATAFVSTFRIKRQQEITIPVDCDFLSTWDPNDLVNTFIGWGEIDAFQISLANCTLSIVVIHEPNV
jgi:hypothetical protein